MNFILKLLSLVYKIDVLFLKRKFKHFGKNVKIGYLSTITKPEYMEFGNNISIGTHATFLAIDFDLISQKTPSIKVGSNVYIGHYASIHSMNNIELQDNVVLSDYVYISDVSHGFELDEVESIMKQPWVSNGPVIIGKGTFIGHGVKIMPDVTLGKNCIVGAGSIVTKSFGDYSVVAGSPARMIKKYCFISKTWRKTDNEGNFSD